MIYGIWIYGGHVIHVTSPHTRRPAFGLSKNGLA